MGYNRTYWQDHVTEHESRYREQQNSDGTITHIPVEGEILQQGTPQDQKNFNNLEEGVFSANEMCCEAIRLLMLNGRTLKTLLSTNGTVQLTNSLQYPFNNSVKTIALVPEMDTTDYSIETSVISANGNVGKFVISDKQKNGFKISYTGSATAVALKYEVKGGLF